MYIDVYDQVVNRTITRERILGLIAENQKLAILMENTGSDNFELSTEGMSLGIFLPEFEDIDDWSKKPLMFFVFNVQHKSRTVEIYETVDAEHSVIFIMNVDNKFSNEDIYYMLLSAIYNFLAALINEDIYVGKYKRKPAIIFPIGGHYMMWCRGIFTMAAKSKETKEELFKKGTFEKFKL